MSKRVIAMICCVAVLTSCLTGCDKGEEEPSSTTSTVVQTSSTTTTVASSEPVSTPVSTWTGTQYENPVDQAKFETLLSRVRSNLEANGIQIIGTETLEREPVDNTSQIVFDPTLVGTDTSSEPEYGGTSEVEEPEEEPFVLTLDVLYAMVYEALGMEMPEEESSVTENDNMGIAGDVITTEEPADESTAEPQLTDEEQKAKEEQEKKLSDFKSAVSDLFKALQTFGDSSCFVEETGEAWASYILYTAAKVKGIEGLGLKVSAAQMKLIDADISADVLHYGYSLDPNRWYHTACVSDLASITSPNEYSKFVSDMCIVEDYTTMPAIGDWYIAPDTPATLFTESFNEKAEEWGIDASLDKVFMSAALKMVPTRFAGSMTKSTYFASDDENYADILYSTEYEDFIVLNQVINYLYRVQGDSFSNLQSYLLKNYTNICNKSEELLQEVYQPEETKTDTAAETTETSEEGEGITEPEEPEYVLPVQDPDNPALLIALDKDGNSVLLSRFFTWLKEDMSTLEYKELCNWLDIENLSYSELKNTLSSSVVNAGIYGFVNSLGVVGSIARSPKLVNDYNWQLGFPIGSKMITEEQLKNIVLTYVIYVGAFTDETYTRALDIALSGIVNYVSKSDYLMWMSYDDNAAELYINRA